MRRAYLVLCVFLTTLSLVDAFATAQDAPAANARPAAPWGQAWPVAPANPLLTARIAGFERGVTWILARQEEHPCAMRFAANGPRRVLEFDGSYLVRMGDDTASYERDPRGRISRATYSFSDGTGFVTEFTYNRQGALAMATTHLGEATITQRFRWQNGQVASVVEVDGTQSPRVMTELVFGYDRRGWPNRMRVRQSREASFDLRFEEGRLVREVDREGNRELVYQYDAEHRLTRAGDAEFFYGSACAAQ